MTNIDQAYTQVLKDHLKPAMGCTEPIAIAYAAAIAKATLATEPESVTVAVSSNIIKNAKSVTVPNTNGKKGIAAACATGIVAGKADRELLVISEVTEPEQNEIDTLLSRNIIQVIRKEDARLFDILIEMKGNGHSVSVRIADRHTNVVSIVRDGEVLSDKALPAESSGITEEESLLTIKGIYEYAHNFDYSPVRELLDRQIDCNMNIAREGIRNAWGASVGRTLLETYGSDNVKLLVRAYAAAGSDARMSGCDKPVIINSGSGNQGITVSVPLIVYAQYMHYDANTLYRALLFSNLTAIHIKASIGCLSAYCGAISAGCAAAAGIAFMENESLEVIADTLTNSLATLSGTVCDGAKPSCAAKISLGLESGLNAYFMAKKARRFHAGDGLVQKDIEETIRNVGSLASNGMRETDSEIVRLMLK